MPETKNKNSKVDSPERFVAIDSNSLIHRAYHAYPQTLTTSKGLLVNAAYGFTSMLLKVLDELKPKYIVCAFDLAKPTFRHKEYDGYKANRKPPDESLVKQFPLVKDVLKAFNVPISEKEGYEADDILGTLGYWTDHGKWSSQDLEQIIVTGDKDLLQMVDENTNVYLPRGSFKNVVMFDKKEVKELFGFGPQYVVDYKAMVGDSSDNIPGIKGVGKKTATKLINKFGHLEDIYDNLESDFLTKREKTLLEKGKENAELSRKLAKIDHDVEMDLDLEDCLLRDFDYDEVVSKFREFEFRSLLKKIPDSIDKLSKDTQENDQQIALFEGKGSNSEKADNVKSLDKFEEFIKDIKVNKIYACFFKKNSALALGVYSNKSEKDEMQVFFIEEFGSNGDLADQLRFLTDISVKVIFYGWKDFCSFLYENLTAKDISSYAKKFLDISRKQIFDVQLGAYYISTGRRDYSIKDLAFAFCGVMLPESEIGDKASSCKYIAALESVSEELEKRIAKHSNGRRFIEKPEDFDYEILEEVDQPLSLVCAAMNNNGIFIDKDGLLQLQKNFEKSIEEIEAEIFNLVGHEFNIASPKQLSEVLFEELELPPQKRTKTGYSTNESVLQSLTNLHPCIEKILEYREVVKLNSTYVKPLLEYADKSRDGRIHTTFNQITTTTGRLSSTDPNLQNLPTRSALGKKIKSIFVAPKHRLLVSADYSQVELRVMAHLSEDENMINDFKSGKDFHTLTAERLLNIDNGKVTKNDRRLAKAINFGVLYGLSAYGLSRQLGIEQSEAGAYIENYFTKYSGVKNYLEKTVDYARGQGYLETILGRRRYFEGISSSNRRLRAALEREAINFPIQGSAADLMRVAMNKAYEWIIENECNCKLLLQIHDELVLECRADDVEYVKKSLKKIMSGILKFKVPLLVDVNIGSSLEEAK